MLTRNYGIWTIRVSANSESKEFRAEFYIPKTDGTKDCWQFYEYNARKKTKPSEIVERVKKIIDALYYGKTDENARKSV